MDSKKIVWLASYPKSGNTWFRAFLTALLGGSEEIDLNGLKTQNIFASRDIFNAFTDLDSTYLYDSEAKCLLPKVYNALGEEIKAIEYIKIHDAYTMNDVGQPIVPAEATKCAIYFIRNPLDIVASLANHMGYTIEQSIALMNNPNGCLATQKNNLNTGTQFRQLILSWSNHVSSWATPTAFPILTLRYEDLLQDPDKFFLQAVRFIGIEVSDEAITRAIAATSFDKLKQKELNSGFKEKVPQAKNFFRSGSSGKWKEELTELQAAEIISVHGDMMKRFGYL